MEKLNNPLRILICHYGIVDKGGFARNFNLAKGLVKLGHKVVLLSATNNFSLKYIPYKREIRDGVEVLTFYDFSPSALLRGGFGFFSILFKSLFSIFNKFDIVHSDTGQRPASGLPCLINKIFHGSIYVSEWWDYFGKGGHFERKNLLKKYTIGLFDHFLEVKNKKYAHGVVCLTEFMKERALKLGINENKLVVINGGADVDSIQFFEESDYKVKLGIKIDKITFGFINIEDSELDDFKVFFSIVSKETYKDKIHIITFGTRLSDKIKSDLKLFYNFTEIGWIDYDKESIKLSAVDFFVILKEDNFINKAGWPNKTGDCLSAGRQIITNGTGDLMKYVQKFPDIFIYCNNNPHEIEDLLKNIIKNFDYYKSKRKYIRQIAEDFFSWNRRAFELNVFYKKLI